MYLGLVMNELARIWKKVIVLCSGYYPVIHLDVLTKTTIIWRDN